MFMLDDYKNLKMSEKAISKGLTKGRLTNRIINDTNARLKIDGAKIIIVELKFTISDGNRTTITKPFDLLMNEAMDDQPSSCIQQHVKNFGLCSFLHSTRTLQRRRNKP